MKSIIAIIAGVLALPAWATDRALIIGNERYQRAASISAADNALDAAEALKGAGFRVASGADLTGADVRARLSALLRERDGADRMVIILSGHFAHSDLGTWFLGTDTDAPDLATVGGEGVSLSVVLELASTARGGAVVLLGSEDRSIALGAGLDPGIRLPDVPQGVTLIVGEADEIADFAERDLVHPGESLAALVADWPDLSASGFLSPLVPFLPANGSGPGPVTPDPQVGDRALWDAAEALDTLDGFQRYLDRYPFGIYASDARASMATIRAEPDRAARLTEDALQLSRDQRRAIQRNLTLLEFNTRGVDGIFGPGTRAAITSWQQRNGAAPTGYLTREAVVRLTAQAERRAGEIEDAERAQKAQQDREDQDYWRVTGESGDVVGLRAYLRRYPDGIYADEAERRLGILEEDRAAQETGRDRSAWQQAEAAGNVAAYRAYLDAWPEGAFVADARARIARVDADQAAIDAAARGEAALNLPVFTRQLVEGRLQAMGLNPGPVDGVFDDATRQALRRYQEARSLPRTGYLNESTVVRLLADVLPGPKL